MAFDTTPQPALQADNLNKSYGAVDVLHDITLTMAEGEFLVLVGPSGCGKSTLLNCIAGLEEITKGTLHIGGRDVTQEPPKDRDIAMVFQSYALYPTMTVGENIGFGMKIRKVPKAEMDAKIMDVATLLQIEHLLDRQPSQLSGGQRQRVAMGRALVRDPKLFLFDEPLSNLDAKLRVEMRAEIKRLHQRINASIVYVTHDQIEAMTLASRIVVLKDGYVQQIGTPAEIYARPANTFVAEFMGSPPMNIVPAETTADGYLADGTLVPADTTEKPAKVLIGCRPEHFSVQTGDVALQVAPTLIENTGADAYVNFVWNGNPVTARLPAASVEMDQPSIDLRLDGQALCVFDADTGALIS
ncbi:ABC transporter ATP-binding protein [Yoonia sp. 208BN28-4]|uniref:ABC transporter ATP-binding protein n=1 Tax=Yoonia sp. 208BN28-4 TaxID=3126505 RepID=UPI0030B2F48A